MKPKRRSGPFVCGDGDTRSFMRDPAMVDADPAITSTFFKT